MVKGFPTIGTIFVIVIVNYSRINSTLYGSLAYTLTVVTPRFDGSIGFAVNNLVVGLNVSQFGRGPVE